MSSIHAVPPPSNPSPPYGLIDILPSQPFDSVPMTVTFSPPGASKVILMPVTNVDAAQNISWKHTGEKPSFSFEADANATYTLLMTDADAPTASDPKYAYWRHWIVPGLHPNSGAEATTKRDVLTEYVAPGKKDENAEKHRYMFILFKEPPPDQPYHSTKRDPAKDVFEARRKFDAKKWIEESGLKFVGLVWFWGS